jgi:hypothetical protein
MESGEYPRTSYKSSEHIKKLYNTNWNLKSAPCNQQKDEKTTDCRSNVSLKKRPSLHVAETQVSANES